MTSNKLFLLLLVLFVLASCGTKTLSEKDYTWMPYNGDETLVFTSNAGERDTIFFLNKDTLTAYPEAQSPFGITYQVVTIFCRHTDPSPPDKKHRYLENPFFSVDKAKDGRAELSPGLLAKDAVFYRLSTIKIDSISKIKPIRLETKYSHYNDVYILEGEDYLNFYNRSNFVTRLYWSKSQGLVRYDKKDTIYWELMKKYSP